jgi:hypothetical protein
MRLIAVLFIAVAVAFISLPASADVGPPNSVGCLQKKAGDMCQTDSRYTGTCVQHTDCVVSSPQPDGGTVMGMPYPCLLCESGADGGASDGGSSSGGGSSGGGGCAITPGRTVVGATFACVGLALAAFAMGRRSKRR